MDVVEKIGTEIAENASGMIKVKKIYDMFWKYRKYGYQRFRRFRGDAVVVGRAGTGKSVLIEHCKKNDIMIKNLEIQSPSLHTEFNVIEGKDDFKMLIVMQGQDLAKKRKELRKALNYKKIKALILVVDYGYTEIRQESVIDEKKHKTLDEIRRDNLKEELEELDKIFFMMESFLDNGKGPKKIIIAINKIDLYYGELDKAKEYYILDKNSPFVKKTDKIIRKYGEINITIEALTVCSQIKNYKWNTEEKKSELTQTEEKNVIFSEFYKKLDQAI